MRARELGIAFVVCFAVELALNAWLIQMPPVWDAVGVFAPAVYLYENGFDLAGLLAMPGYPAGGPNIHSLSLSTQTTVLAVTESPSRESPEEGMSSSTFYADRASGG